MKIVVADRLEKNALEMLKKLGNVVETPEDLCSQLGDADVLIVRSKTKVNSELLDSSSVKLVLRAGVGLDNVDLEHCKSKNIEVRNTPGTSTNAVAELAIAALISCARNVPKAHFQMKNNVWDKKNLLGFEIRGKTLGIFGYGRIGHAVGEKAKALGMDIIAYDPFPKKDLGIKFVSRDELFSKSDFITLHCALTGETKEIINAENIGKMKDGVVLINLARGGLIDEDAFYNACKSGKIISAHLDVYPKEPYGGKLLELENVLFTPHLGASTREAQMNIANELVRIIREKFNL